MCGIAGFWDPSGLSRDAESVLRWMVEAVRHRGPDDDGQWLDADAGIALGHRRLSIVDLSPAGHQPMISHDGRYVIVLNGEIYNHRELRGQLEQETSAEKLVSGWRGHSDTEVLLELISRYGIAEALKRVVGMFALAV